METGHIFPGTKDKQLAFLWWKGCSYSPLFTAPGTLTWQASGFTNMAAALQPGDLTDQGPLQNSVVKGVLPALSSSPSLPAICQFSARVCLQRDWGRNNI